MQLYLLTLKPTSYRWDVMLSCVVRAASEQRAREIAQKSGYDETRNGKTPWLNLEESHCEVLDLAGLEGLVLANVLNS